jgi:Zn-finger protein
MVILLWCFTISAAEVCFILLYPVLKHRDACDIYQELSGGNLLECVIAVLLKRKKLAIVLLSQLKQHNPLLL